MDKERLRQLEKLEEAIPKIRTQINKGYGCLYMSTNYDTAGLCEVPILKCPYMNEDLSCGYDRIPQGKDMDEWEGKSRTWITKERELASKNWLARRFSNFYK